MAAVGVSGSSIRRKKAKQKRQFHYYGAEHVAIYNAYTQPIAIALHSLTIRANEEKGVKEYGKLVGDPKRWMEDSEKERQRAIEAAKKCLAMPACCKAAIGYQEEAKKWLEKLQSPDWFAPRD